MTTVSKRRWFQFSTRSILLLMTAVAIGLGLWVSKMHRRNQALNALSAVGGVSQRTVRYEHSSSPTWLPPRWLARLLGEEFFRQPVEIRLASSPKLNGDAAFQPLGELESLKRLSLDFTGAGDEGMPYLRALPNLEYLELTQSRAGDNALANMSGLSKLKELKLSRTRVTDAGLCHLATLKSLRAISLERTGISDDGLRQVANLQKLESLDLRQTALQGSAFGELPKLNDLQHLLLSNTAFQDDALKWLANFPRLETLSLDGTPLNGSGFAALDALPALTNLDLSKTALTDAGLRSLPPAAALQTLKLNDTAVTDAGFAGFDRFKSLEALELRGTRITGNALRYLKTLPRLSYLNLCDTQIDDGDIDALNEMCPLVSVSLIGTRVTEDGLTRLQMAGSLASEPVDARTLAAFREPTELDFLKQPLTDVIDYLKQRHDQEIQVDSRMIDTEDPRFFRALVTSSQNGISFLQALEELLAPKNLVLVYRHSVPLIMARPIKPALCIPQLVDGEELPPRLAAVLTRKNAELDFADEPLPDVVRFLAQRHAIEISFDDDAFRRAGKTYDLPVSRAIKGIPLRSALGLLLEPLDMTCNAEGEALVIRPAG